PQNHVLPYRNPIFIDPHGTACAVGQLMIESGHRDLAERIDAAMETGYLAEIIADERFTAPVSAWATEHGFTADELAWIQPGYSPPILWYTLGEGTNGTVDEVLALSNGDLLVAGQFTDAGGTTCNGAARWNGSSYTAMGTLPEGVINCAIEFNGEIYIGGSFNNGQTDLLHWSDAGWDGEAVFASKWAEVTALHSHEGMLYAAGSGSGFAGTDYGVKVLQEGGWLPLPGVLNGPIHALEHHENYLIAGGAFTGEFLSLENDIMHVARYMDSGWRQVADGLDGTVYDLLILDGALYATGDMVSMMGTSFGLASIIGDVDTWMRLMPNIQHYIAPSPVDAPSVARAMVVKDGRIFIAGDINAFQGLTYGTGLVVYNGTPDSVEPYCNFMGPANSIALSGSQLVLAGASDAFANIIVTELGTGVNDTPRPLVLAFAPNPVKHQLTVTLPVGMSAPTSIRVTDAAGRIIDVDAQPTSTGMVIDVLGLATGSYAIELSDGIRTATGRFVKE
ncbi:MAG: T9SS type A sorting domain-containing protein, partial [Flavobacteriales bacterium]|nr:T9SS type A sorting domain-containing protein [Flavobacteriales bacterium]